ncbi:MAG: FecR family protein [Polaromonas sp.]|nr:FecR family protein [Polaromonas sp.]
MKYLLITAMAFCAVPGTTLAQAQPVGRILALAGQASLSRDGRPMPLVTGTVIQNGDTLEVGDRSTLQVRFTDDSVVALRANSEFRIEDYRFDRNAGADRSVFGLLRGGMRTITGLIGKTRPASYHVHTPTSTIGIRGTHFSLVSCNNDCRNPDGSQGANGTFGGVTDGRITVSNASGQQEFGQQDFFHVPSASSPPIRLLAPPAILGDRGGAARTRTAAAPAGSSAQAVAEAPGDNNSGPQTSTSPQLTVQSAPVTALVAPLTTVAATDQPVLADSGGNNRITVVETRMADQTLVESNARTYTVRELRSDVTELNNASFTDAASLATAFRTVMSVGSSAAAAAYWIYEPPETGSGTLMGSHHAWGDTPAIALPGSGTAQYNFAGGTNPSDNYGRVGTFTSSHLLMDFGTRQIRNASAMGISFGAGSSVPAATVYTVPAMAVWSMGGGPHALPVTCSPTCASPAGAINGRFVGASLQGYIASISVSTPALSSGQANAAGSVAAFAKQ